MKRVFAIITASLLLAAIELYFVYGLIHQYSNHPTWTMIDIIFRLLAVGGIFLFICIYYDILFND